MSNLLSGIFDLRAVTKMWPAIPMIVLQACATTYVPEYQEEVIRGFADMQPEPSWVEPSYSELTRLASNQGISGVRTPASMPNFLAEREPPFVDSMTLLSDGALLVITPLEYQYQSKRFVLGTYHRESIVSVKVTKIDGESGQELWSKKLRASGVFATLELKSVLVVSAEEFDTGGNFSEKVLAAYDRENGTLLWERRFDQLFRYLTISPENDLLVFSVVPSEEEATAARVEAIDARSGKAAWSLDVPVEPGIDPWPIINGENLLVFDGGTSLWDLKSGSNVWKNTTVNTTGSMQPIVADDLIVVQTTTDLVAIRISGGMIAWKTAMQADEVVQASLTPSHIYVAVVPDGGRSQDHALIMIDTKTGKQRWRSSVPPILGNIVESSASAYLTTVDTLIQLDLVTGDVVRELELPWEDEFSYHEVSLNGDLLIVENEWNVVTYDASNLSMKYHHEFEPLVSIMTTEERMLEQRWLGHAVSAHTVNALSFDNHQSRAQAGANFNANINRYRATGNSLYLDSAYSDYGRTQAAIGQERVNAGIQFNIAMSNAINTVGDVVMKEKLRSVNLMVYPQIDGVLKQVRAFDNGEFTVRLSGKELDGQRFAVVEVVRKSNGKSTEIVLSPSQMPQEVTTIAQSPWTGTELTGYYTAAMYLGHTFSTVVDLERSCVFHYGPGMRTNEFVKYGDTGFLRGRLWRFDLRLPPR